MKHRFTRPALLLLILSVLLPMTVSCFPEANVYTVSGSGLSEAVISSIDPGASSDVAATEAYITAEPSESTAGISSAPVSSEAEDEPAVPLNPYENIASYASEWYYDYLGTLENGSELQETYRLCRKAAYAFHNGNNIAHDKLCDGSHAADLDGSDALICADIKIPYGNLTFNDIAEIWISLKRDNPALYWISGSFYCYSYGSDLHFTLLCDGRYSDPSVRHELNSLLYKKTEELCTGAEALGSVYKKALFFHDSVCGDVKYAEMPDGTPSTEIRTHNIEGWLRSTEGVCECYSKAFEAIMNAAGIPCHSVISLNHMWNIVRFDDGNWYWVDLTFDDTSSPDDKPLSVYFCRNDTEPIWENSGYVGEGNFLENAPVEHSFLPEGGIDTKLPAAAASGYPEDYTYLDLGIILIPAIPERSVNPYKDRE